MKSKRRSARSQALLQQKREAAKVLKKAGLLQRQAGKRITNKYLSGSYFRSLRAKYADVISGEARAAKVEPSVLEKFRAAGFRVKGGKVVVPQNVTPRQVRLTAAQLPPVPPRPPRQPRFGGHRFDDCLERVIEWLIHNYDDRLGDLEERIDKLHNYARQYPNIFRDVVNASHLQGERYLAGQPSIVNPWPEGIGSEIFRTLYPELYYYHPSDYAYAVTGGLIPRC